MTTQELITILATPIEGQARTYKFEAQVNDNRKIFEAEWNFGDGNTSDQNSPVHTYATAGDYNVSVDTVLIGPRPDGEKKHESDDKRPSARATVSIPT